MAIGNASTAPALATCVRFWPPPPALPARGPGIPQGSPGRCLSILGKQSIRNAATVPAFHACVRQLALLRPRHRTRPRSLTPFLVASFREIRSGRSWVLASAICHRPSQPTALTKAARCEHPGGVMWMRSVLNPGPAPFVYCAPQRPADRSAEPWIRIVSAAT